MGLPRPAHAAPEGDRRAPLTEATLVADNAKALGSAVSAAQAVGAGYATARRLAQMPGNLCTPELLEETARDIAKRHGLKVTALGRKEMEREKMGSFLCVAQGTPQDPRLVAIEYRKGPKDQKPIVLVGKGLCFDTGGISIKPAERMEFMKFDMCGAAGVLGAMEAIARLALPVNVVGVFGATTNMPSGTAVKPGDVVTASTGKTIEIINTDAEGRLVLADVLAWVTRFDPVAVVDAATLTGACVIALGNTTTGALGNDDALVAEVVGAATRASEPAWQLPMFDDYREQIKSDVADIKNTGGRAGGTITAAMFLREFVSYPWVHLDVAGTAYSEVDLGIIPKGPTGTPTGTFIEFVRGERTDSVGPFSSARRPRPRGRGRFARDGGGATAPADSRACPSGHEQSRARQGRLAPEGEAPYRFHRQGEGSGRLACQGARRKAGACRGARRGAGASRHPASR
ncbi:MAG: leucyl aminopeptidase [Gemmatimonadaceae bacterium]